MTSLRKALINVMLPLVTWESAFAGDLDKAPPGFPYYQSKAVFADFSNVGLALTFDALNGKAKAET